MPNIIHSTNNHIKKLHDLRIIGISSGLLLCLIMFLTIHPVILDLSSVSATSPTASTTTLTMTQGSGTASINLAVKDPDGTFVTSTDDEKIKFNITTNNYTGYTLIISSSSDDGLLTNGSGSSLSSIDAILGTSDFDTSTHNNEWGYKPSKYNGVRNEAYLPAPTTTATVLDKTMEANSIATANNTYDIGLGARADYSTPAGSYSASFIITAVANPVPYSISFTDTSGDTTVAGMPETILGSTDDVEVKLPTNIPQRTGYTFAGWCNTTPTSSATSCPGTIYQPSTLDTPVYVGIDQTAAMNATTLYTIWTPVPVTPTVNVTVNFGGTGVSAVAFVANDHNERIVQTTGSTATLDVGVAYTMTAYLESSYEFSSWSLNDASYGTLSSTTTNPTTFTTNANSGSAVITATGAKSCIPISGAMQAFAPTADTCTSGTLTDSRDDQTYTVAKINNRWWMTQNLRYMGDTVGSSSTTTTWYLKSATSNIRADKTMTMTDLISNSPVAYNSYDDAKYHDSGNTANGVWYNYAAASAMTITGNDNQNTQTYDICPKGWRLPTNNEFSGITGSIITSSAIAAFSSVTGGFYSSGSLISTEFGFWWSATSSTATYRYNLRYNGSNLDIINYDRNRGIYVRCVKE